MCVVAAHRVNKHLSMWSMEYCIGVFVWEQEVSVQLVVVGSVVVVKGCYVLGVVCMLCSRFCIGCGRLV